MEAERALTDAFADWIKYNPNATRREVWEGAIEAAVGIVDSFQIRKGMSKDDLLDALVERLEELV